MPHLESSSVSAETRNHKVRRICHLCPCYRCTRNLARLVPVVSAESPKCLGIRRLDKYWDPHDVRLSAFPAVEVNSSDPGQPPGATSPPVHQRAPAPRPGQEHRRGPLLLLAHLMLSSARRKPNLEAIPENYRMASRAWRALRGLGPPCPAPHGGDM